MTIDIERSDATKLRGNTTKNRTVKEEIAETFAKFSES